MLRVLASRWEMNVGFWDLCVSRSNLMTLTTLFLGRDTNGSPRVTASVSWQEYSSVVSHDSATVVRCPDLPDGGFFDASAGTV